MLKMVDGTGIIGVDMICPLGVSTPQPPNYDRVELEGTGMLVLPNSLDAPLERLELGGKTEQVQTTGANLFDEKLLLDFDSENYNKTQSGSGFYYYKFPVNGTVTVSTKNVNKNGEYLTVGIKPDGSDKTWLSHGSAYISKYKTLTPEDGNIYLGVNNNLERVKSMIQNAGGIIINEGSVAKPYEPYTGGKPSPSQEYQQEVKNTGKLNADTQKYEVGAKVTGKNLFDYEKAKEKSNRTTSANGAGFVEFAVYVCAGSTVTVSNNTKINNPGLYYYGVALKSSEDFKYFICYPGYPNSKDTHTFTATEDYIYVRCNKTSLNDVIGVCGGLQVEIGASRTAFESYKEQSLTLTSDRPITKWDRLVEQGGQIGWLYNSANETIDGKTGKWSIQPASKIFYRTDITFPIAVPFCSELLGYDYSSVGYKKDTGISINNLGILCITLPEEVELTLDAYKQYLADNPLHVLYKDDSEEFVPLPQSEQNAIRALKTYYPTTVITADGGELDPDIKVTYRKEI